MIPTALPAAMMTPSGPTGPRELTELADLDAASRLLAEVWGLTGGAQVSPALLRVLGDTGNYVAGVVRAGELVGVSVGLFHAPDDRALHSHITGVRADAAGHGIGLALKQHQRAWALARDVDVVTWTFDPLVARNAQFNLAKLGARVVGYRTNHYGPMADALNGTDETDRLEVRWHLGEGPPAPPSPDGETVAVPRDIEALRRSDPAQAHRWRLRVRERLTTLLAAGGRIDGFDRERGYLVGTPS